MPTAPLDAAQRATAITSIDETPARLRRAVHGLVDQQLDTPYRPGGWTVRQVVHHLPDSHINSYCRFKLALTEDTPVIKTYEEARWAELPDARAPIEISMALLDALHRRWVLLLRHIPDDGWNRTLRHPDMGVMRVDWLLAFYGWHGPHHVAHVTRLRERKGW